MRTLFSTFANIKRKLLVVYINSLLIFGENMLRMSQNQVGLPLYNTMNKWMYLL